MDTTSCLRRYTTFDTFHFSLSLTPFIYPQGIGRHGRRSQGEFVGKCFPTNDFVWGGMHNSLAAPKPCGKI